MMDANSAALLVHEIPNEIIFLWFSYLSQKELIAAALVCSRWLQIAYDAHFWTNLDLSSSGKKINQKITALLQRYPRLKQIDLHKCSKLSNKTLQQLTATCTNLESLDLTDCTKISSIGLCAVAMNCSKIRELRLNIAAAGMLFTSLAEEPISSNQSRHNPTLYSHLTRLELLALTQPTSLAIQDIACFFHLLQTLSLVDATALNASDFSVLANSSLHLRELHISRIRSEFIPLLSPLCQRGLEALALHNPQDGLLGTVLAELMMSCPLLTSLSLHNLHYDLLPLFSALTRGCPRLRVLDLSEGSIYYMQCSAADSRTHVNDPAAFTEFVESHTQLSVVRWRMSFYHWFGFQAIRMCSRTLRHCEIVPRYSYASSFSRALPLDVAAAASTSSTSATADTIVQSRRRRRRMALEKYVSMPDRFYWSVSTKIPAVRYEVDIDAPQLEVAEIAVYATGRYRITAPKLHDLSIVLCMQQQSGSDWTSVLEIECESLEAMEVACATAWTVTRAVADEVAAGIARSLTITSKLQSLWMMKLEFNAAQWQQIAAAIPPSVTDLKFDQSKVTNEAITIITRQCRQLQCVALICESVVTADGIAAFARCGQLRSLEIKECAEIDDDCILEVERSRPDVQVYFTPADPVTRNAAVATLFGGDGDDY